MERNGGKKGEEGTRLDAELEVKSSSKANVSEIRAGSRMGQGRPPKLRLCPAGQHLRVRSP